MTNVFQPIAFIELGQINCFQILQILGSICIPRQTRVLLYKLYFYIFKSIYLFNNTYMQEANMIGGNLSELPARLIQAHNFQRL